MAIKAGCSARYTTLNTPPCTSDISPLGDNYWIFNSYFCVKQKTCDLSLSLSLSHTDTQTHVHALAHTHIHTHTHTHTHTHNLKKNHLTVSLSYSSQCILMEIQNYTKLQTAILSIIKLPNVHISGIALQQTK